MNISFNGLIHISGNSEQVGSHIENNVEKYAMNPITLDFKDHNHVDIFILTEEDGEKYLKENGATEGSAKKASEAGITLSKKFIKLLTNKELIMKYFNEQKANGAEIEEIKL